jgi:hypothetical protein
MADVEKRQSYGPAVERPEHSKSEIDHERAQLYKISAEDDARVRRKVDMVVLPMEC